MPASRRRTERPILSVARRPLTGFLAVCRSGTVRSVLRNSGRIRCSQGYSYGWHAADAGSLTKQRRRRGTAGRAPLHSGRLMMSATRASRARLAAVFSLRHRWERAHWARSACNTVQLRCNTGQLRFFSNTVQLRFFSKHAPLAGPHQPARRYADTIPTSPLPPGCLESRRRGW